MQLFLNEISSVRVSLKREREDLVTRAPLLIIIKCTAFPLSIIVPADASNLSFIAARIVLVTDSLSRYTREMELFRDELRHQRNSTTCTTRSSITR